MTNHILVTGGAGYVGSHTCKLLAASGYTPVVYDDLRRGNRWAVQWGPLVEAPLEDRETLISAMKQYDIRAVIHFAAYAYVGESMTDPSIYFRNNVAATLNVLDAMVEMRIAPFIISSTCAVYGTPPSLPIKENMPIAPISPYGASKVMLEELARWYGFSHGIRTFGLRYFNAAGTDPDGKIGELHEPEPHLIPIVIEAALGRRTHVEIMGADYPTSDGTAIRDYVHVSDLAKAHVAALEYLSDGGGSEVANLGTGQGISVRQIIEAVAQETGVQITAIEGPRRLGDPPELYADPTRANDILGWSAYQSDLTTIVRTAVRWYRDILPNQECGA
jgi:UDP-arabinose 4-epimerase